jgi:CRP-like cAMP-binding protein
MATTGWLSRRPAKFRADVLARSTLRHYAAKEAIYREGDASNCLMGLVAGRWVVRVPPADVAITLGQPGFWVGEAGYFRGVARAASVISAGPSMGLCLPAVALEQLMDHVGYCRHFAANTAETLAEAIAVIGVLSQPRSDIRVAQRLATMAVFNGRADNVIPLSQADLAELCNLSRSSIIEILQDFVSQGLISLGYRRILITDLEALSDRAWNGDRLFR